MIIYFLYANKLLHACIILNYYALSFLSKGVVVIVLSLCYLFKYTYPLIGALPSTPKSNI